MQGKSESKCARGIRERLDTPASQAKRKIVRTLDVQVELVPNDQDEWGLKAACYLT